MSQRHGDILVITTSMCYDVFGLKSRKQQKQEFKYSVGCRDDSVQCVWAAKTDFSSQVNHNLLVDLTMEFRIELGMMRYGPMMVRRSKMMSTLAVFLGFSP